METIVKLRDLGKDMLEWIKQEGNPHVMAHIGHDNAYYSLRDSSIIVNPDLSNYNVVQACEI